ncbi:MAG: hypothetical protein R8M38_08515 [Mariprofundaceae bacterium]
MCLLLLFSLPVCASTVVKVTLQQAVAGSELIFEGRVLSKVSRTHSASGMPFSWFTFEVLDVVKGSYRQPTIELGFMGGSVDGASSLISDLKMPKVGERGIYFVESLARQQVHPLFGWSQGHYLVRKNSTTGAFTVVPTVTSSQGMTEAIPMNQFKSTIKAGMK